ncbi:Hsp20/alpha crystallin family protein [Mitsuaria sp. GD03876]|uniref:Hsp20/alpha crystallin family protein n=1 Tax=Mitsuaria sp. GD03876 TaxID=2975399 RepID=UPI0024485A08|nr:Hsp20/alpha crystallin family protein [Mitsuaria sp. GD03876]MDH0864151.1 Hsp20/alpha crystallin family protein [Mitsuaria sp. GD03876]
MSRPLSARALFNDLDRFQREMSSLFELSAGRGTPRGGYPALNVGLSPEAVEVYAFAPGLDPATIGVDLDRGVLSLSGERLSPLSPPAAAGSATEGEAAPPAGKTLVHQRERFAGKFRRVVSLPDDIDPEQVTASYKDGVLRVSVQRRPAPQPRRIDIH